MIGFIYVIKNHINNKLYIGQTTRIIEIRWKEHIRHSKYDDLIIYRAIRKYGVQNFYIEKLEEVIYNKQEELDARETYYISLYNTIDKSKGYNISTGGSTPKFYRKKLDIDSIKNLYVDKKFLYIK